MYNENKEVVYLQAKEKLDEMKKRLYENEDSKEALKRLDDNLTEVINPELNNDAFDDIYFDLRDNIMTEIYNQTIEMDDALKNTFGNSIEESLNEVLNDDSFREKLKQSLYDKFLNDNDGKIPSDEELQTIYNNFQEDLINNIKENSINYINENIYSFSVNVINTINENIYKIPEIGNSNQILSEFTNNMINDCSSFIQEQLNSFVENGTFDESITSNLVQSFNDNLNSLKVNSIENVNEQINSQVNNIVNRVNENIGEVFCAPRIELTENGLNIDPGKINLENLSIGGVNVGGILSNFKNNLPSSTNIPNSNQAIEKLKTKFKENALSKNTNVNNMTSNTPNNNSKSTNVQNRNESNNIASSSKQNKKEQKIPEAEEYDNSKPERAEVKNDPRRQKCQELVLWEGKEDKYVLLTNAIGDYILLDEKKKCVRIQHSSGSYIQFSSNGDISIEASNKVYINSQGSGKVEQC